MLIATAAVLLAVVALLAVPLTLSFRVDTTQLIDYRVTLRWAFGLVRLRFGSKTGPASRDEKAGKTARRRRPAKGGRKSGALAALRFAPFRRRLQRFVRDLWRAVHKKDVELSLRVGLGDPADTGRLWALLGPVAGMLASIQNASLRLLPEFTDAVVELRGSGEIRIVPLEIMWLATALLLSPPIWRGMLRLRGERA